MNTALGLLLRMAYEPKFPDRFEQWVSHDLTKYRPSYYEGLKEHNFLKVWEFIELNYLNKFNQLILIDFEWGTHGLWKIKFPGSVDMGSCMIPEDIELPLQLIAELELWHSEREEESKPWEDNDLFDYEASNAKRLTIAKKIKAFLGRNYYIECRSFRELKIQNNEVIEADVPEFIRNVCNESPA